MKAVMLKKTGKPDVLKIKDIPEPQPGAGEVRIKLHYAGLNYAEILSRKGLYGWRPKTAYIPGMEGAGVIETIGEGVSQELIGKPVMVGTKYGCYAEKVVVPAKQALPAIPDYTMEESAAFLVNYMTAWIALFELAKVQPDETVLITAAAGGVGSAAVQLCSRFGCKVYALAGSEEKLELVKKLGAYRGLNYRLNDYDQKIREENEGVDVVLEMVGGDIYKKNMKLTRPFGRIVVAGFASFNLKKWNPFSWYRTWKDIPRVPIAAMSHRSIGVFAMHLGYLLKKSERTMQCYERLRSFVIEHKIRPVVGKIFPLDQVAEAHRFIESRQSKGKVLLKV